MEGAPPQAAVPGWNGESDRVLGSAQATSRAGPMSRGVAPDQGVNCQAKQHSLIPWNSALLPRGLPSHTQGHADTRGDLYPHGQACCTAHEPAHLPYMSRQERDPAIAGTTQSPPQRHAQALTCPWTMAFSRASTACRASGGRSGCSRSATAFQRASTACCGQRRGTVSRVQPLEARTGQGARQSPKPMGTRG